MSSEAHAEPVELEDRIRTFLMRNFPQIAMHGGNAGIERIDHDTGEVWLTLGGACSGCGISPMTVQAITHRMPDEIPEITAVHADAGGFGASPGFPGDSAGRDADRSFPDAPF